MAALIREPPRGDGPARRISLRASADEIDVSKIARASGAGVAPAGRRLLERRLDRGDHGVHPPRVRRGSQMARKGALDPSGLVLFDKPAGPSSFAIVRQLREQTGRAGRACGDARPVRDRAPARPARELHEGGAAVRRAVEALRDGGRPLADDVDGRSRGRGRRRARGSVSCSSSRRSSTLCAVRSTSRSPPRRR